MRGHAHAGRSAELGHRAEERMMAPTPADPTEGVPGHASRIARIEGYLALLCVVALFLGPAFPALPQPVGLALGVSIWACGWLFAISGVRHGAGGARVAAGICLAILVLHAASMLVIVLH
jgi:hypothetical protein